MRFRIQADDEYGRWSTGRYARKGAFDTHCDAIAHADEDTNRNISAIRHPNRDRNPDAYINSSTNGIPYGNIDGDTVLTSSSA